MIRPVPLAALIGMAALAATPVFATDTPEQQQLKRLQQQIDQMRQDYEARLKALEARVRQAEAGSSAAAAPLPATPSAATAAAPASTPAAEPLPAPVAASHCTCCGQCLQPGHLADPVGQLCQPVAGPGALPHQRLPHRRRDRPGRAGLLARRVRTHHLGQRRSLVLRLAERGARRPTTVPSVEEAYLQTTALPAGLAPARPDASCRASATRTTSMPTPGTSSTQPLVYQAFLEGAAEAGWPAAARACCRPSSSSNWAARSARPGRFPAAAAMATSRAPPPLFAHTGGDVGASHSWRAGLSYLWAKSNDRES